MVSFIVGVIDFKETNIKMWYQKLLTISWDKFACFFYTDMDWLTFVEE